MPFLVGLWCHRIAAVSRGSVCHDGSVRSSARSGDCSASGARRNRERGAPVVLTEAVRLASVGAVIGLAGAIVSTPLLRGMLYEGRPARTAPPPWRGVAAGWSVGTRFVLAGTPGCAHRRYRNAAQWLVRQARPSGTQRHHRGHGRRPWYLVFGSRLFTDGSRTAGRHRSAAEILTQAERKLSGVPKPGPGPASAAGTVSC